MHAAIRPARSRHIFVIAFAVLGLAGGLAAARPQPYASSDFVFLTTVGRSIQNQAMIATSNSVLNYALRHLGLNEPVSSLRPRVQATVATDRVIRITAQGMSPYDASREVTAITDGYLRLLTNDQLPTCQAASAAGGRGLPCVRRAHDAYVLGRPAVLPHLPLVAVGTESAGLGLAAGLVVAALILMSGAAATRRRQGVTHRPFRVTWW